MIDEDDREHPMVMRKPLPREVAASPQLILSLLGAYLVEMRTLVSKLGELANCSLESLPNGNDKLASKRRRQRKKLDRLRHNSVPFWVNLLSNEHHQSPPLQVTLLFQKYGAVLAPTETMATAE